MEKKGGEVMLAHRILFFWQYQWQRRAIANKGIAPVSKNILEREKNMNVNEY